MKLQPMSYKSYVWPFNPEKIQIEYVRNLREIKLPFSGSILQNLGCNKRVVTGMGEFIGSDCMAEFARLANVFAEGNDGMLKLTEIPPFTAAFSSLKMVGEAQPDCVTYEFEFFESTDSGEKGHGETETGIYVCIGGENLWSLAAIYGTDVDRLKALNPMIQWPNFLEAGQKVVLP